MFRIRVHLLLFIYLFNLISRADSLTPQSVFCADPACKEPISEAQGKIMYVPAEKNVLSFGKGAKVVILGKSKEKDGYWLGQIGDKNGFVPPSHLKEVTVWKSSDMLIHKVPLSIENHKIILKNGPEHNNLGQKNAGRNPLPDKNSPTADYPSNGSGGSPLSNLIHGDISTISGESLQENVKNKPQTPQFKAPDPNLEPSRPDVDTGETKLPPNVNNGEFIDEQEVNEIVDSAETDYDDDDEESLDNVFSSDSSAVVEDEEDLSVPIRSSTPDQLNTQRSGVVVHLSGKPERKVEGEEEQEDVPQTEEADSAGSHEKLSNVPHINERLAENLRGNVVGSMRMYNSAKDLEEMGTGSSTLPVGNDTDNFNVSNTVSNSSSSSSSGSDGSISGSSISDSTVTNSGGSSKTSSSDGNSINLQTSDRNSLGEKSLHYTPPTEVYQTTVLPVEYNMSEFNMLENENENVSQNILPNVNTSSDGNLAQENIPPPANPNEIQSALENANALNKKIDDSVNANRNTPEGSSRDGIVTDGGSSSAGNSVSSGSGTIFSASSVAASSSDVNYDRTTENNAKFSDVTVDQLPNENTAIYQDTEQFLRETNIPDSMDGISTWAAQFGHTPVIEVAEKNIDSVPTSQESLNTQNNEAQPGAFTVQTSSAGEPVLSATPDIPAPTATISSQEDATEKFEAFVPTEGSVEKPDNGFPDQEYASSADSVTETIEEKISEGTVTEPWAPATDSAADSAEESPLENGVPAENTEDSGLFSELKNSVLQWFGLSHKNMDHETEIERDEVVSDDLINDFSTETPSQESTAGLEGSCKLDNDVDVDCEDLPPEEFQTGFWSTWMGNNSIDLSSSLRTLMYLIVTAVTVLLFTLGYYYIEKFQVDGPLVAKINKLEQELLVSSRECLLLKDELSNTKEKLNLFETSSNDKIITALQLELEESKKVRSVLESNIEVLQQELDAATEAGLDLNRMLSEVLTQSGGSETLMKSVEHLQSQLNNQQKIIDEMTTKLIEKTKENQELQNELSTASEKIDSLESEIEDMRENLNVHLKDSEDVIKNLTSKNNELQLKINKLNENKEKEVSKLKNLATELENKVKSVSVSLKIKEEECNNLKDSVKKIKMKDNKNIDSLFDASRIKAELAQSTSENTSLKDRLKVEEDKVLKFEDNVKALEEEIQKLKLESEEAQKEKVEARTRLEVLTNYFKEKEALLQKELGLKEALWVQKQGDESTIYERIKSLEEEINSYKSQNDTLKKEILDQERSLKAQIAGLEKKAHDNWIAARQAERKLEESKQEGAQLRNKLTLLEKNMSNDLDSSQHHRTGEEVNGGDSLPPLIHDTSSPLLFPPPLPLDPNSTPLMPPGFIPPPMFMPPPPNNFMPPPPPFLPGDHRPPPLGRMSSPPLNNRFSPPPPPEYAYDRMSTPPMSPSNRNFRSHNESDRDRFRHRTPTSPSFRSRNWQESPTVGMSGFRPITSERDTRREHKAGSNLSSGHSSDSLDKSSRHSGRV